MDWFWELFGFGPNGPEGLGSAGQALIEVLPIVFGIVVILGLFVTISSTMRGKEEEEETVEGMETKELTKLDLLDLEIAEIRRLQGKRL